MSVPVTSQALQLPLFDSDTICVNNGTDVVYLSTMRDMLGGPFSYALQPLASLTLGGGQQYYAKAASGTQFIDMLAGALGFSPSPQQVVSVLNTATLAAAITTAGSRLVDTIPGGTSGTVNAPGNFAFVDCSQAVSFTLSLTVQAAGSSILPASNFSGTITVLLEWKDGLGNIVAPAQLYEIIGGSTSPVTTLITDRCLGPNLSVTWVTGRGAGGLTGTVNINWQIVTSSRPADRARIVTTASVGDDTDGLLVDLGAVIPAAGSTGKLFAYPTVGRLAYILRCNAGGPFNVTLGWGFSQLAPWAYQQVASPNTDSQFEIPAANRPLCITITNTGAIGNYSFKGWTQSD